MIQERTLSNGLRVVVDPSPAAPLAAIYLWFDAGASAEHPGEYGLAHLLEHMLFKGTPTRGVGEAAAAIEGLGGDLNAWTSFDETVLHATVDAQAFEEALGIVVDMARASTIDPVEFAREKPVVLEELRGYENDPMSVVSDATSALLFSEHPYARPILGTVESVTGLERDALVQFTRRAYRPDRAVLSVAGDVTAPQVFDAVERLLADWQGVAEPIETPLAAPLTAPRVTHLRRAFDTAVTEISWVMPALGHADIPALDVLMQAFVDSAAAPLSERLQHEDGLVLDVWSALSFRTAGGQCSVGFLPHPGKTEDALEALLQELDKVRRGRLPATSVARARDAILADFLFAKETVDGRAHDAAWYIARMGGTDAREGYRRAVAAVTSEQVADVARRWLDPAHAAVVSLAPAVDTARMEMALRRSSPLPRRRFDPTLLHLPGGARLWVLPEDSPVAACRAAVLGGGLAETPRTAGRSAAWARMATAGAGELDPTGLSEALDELSATLAPVSGRNSLGVRSTFPAYAASEALDLVGSVLAAPGFDEEEWVRVREDLLEDLRTEADHPSAVAWRAAGPRLWPGHPWRLPSFGSASTIERLGPRGLSRWHKGLFTQPALVMAVVGGVEPALVEDVLGPWVERLGSEPGAVPERAMAAPMRPGVVRVRAGHEQAQVGLQMRFGGYHDPDRRALELASAWLGAQGGPLFLDLRERRSLAYQVWASAVPGVDGGTFELGLATDPARLAEAHQALRIALERAVTEGPDEAELARYRRMTMGHAAMALQRAAGRASHVALSTLYGQSWDLDLLRAELEAVRPEQVRDAMARVVARGLLSVLVEPRLADEAVA